jgi:feruloyl esterase
VSLPDTTIESAVVENNVCQVTAVTTHPPTEDRITIWIHLPLSGWNGRFQGTGGGGFLGGSPNSLPGPVAQGYAAGSTDTGHEGGRGSFALKDTGGLNWQLIRDNAHVGIHEMTVTGKALTEAFYGEAPGYAYFTGCSTGGRQGFMEAQRYPADYDGILAGAPAINWPKLHVQQLWGPMLMSNADNPVANCKLAAATQAAVMACDDLDGVKDGIIENPMVCDFDPHTLVGKSAGQCGTITATDASIIARVLEGPRRVDGSFLWYGMPWGADMSALSGSDGQPLQAQAMPITLDWWRYFLTEDPEFDWTEVTHEGYERFWEQSVEQFGEVIGTDNPDLSAYRDRDGKIIVWHGWADQLITIGGTIDYYEKVVDEMGGTRRANEFIRFFTAPGVAHCRGGDGPQPYGQLEALVEWVENGNAPETLPAAIRDERGEFVRTRPLCQFPQVAVYDGSGSTDDASNFTCRAQR